MVVMVVNCRGKWPSCTLATVGAPASCRHLAIHKDVTRRTSGAPICRRSHLRSRTTAGKMPALQFKGIAVTRHCWSAGILPASRHPQGRYAPHEWSADLPTVSPSIADHGRQDAGATVQGHRRHAPLLERRHPAGISPSTRTLRAARVERRSADGLTFDRGPRPARCRRYSSRASPSRATAGAPASCRHLAIHKDVTRRTSGAPICRRSHLRSRTTAGKMPALQFKGIAVTRHCWSAGILPASRHPQGRYAPHEWSAGLPTVSPSITDHGRQDAGATVQGHRSCRHAPLL